MLVRFIVCIPVLMAACISTSAQTPRAGSVPLIQAIAEFNAKALHDPIGKEQSPMTEAEVLAAIRLAEAKDFLDAPKPLFQSFKNIARARALPPNASFDLLTGLDPGADFIFDVWYVRIMLPKDDGGSYSFTIRNRIIRSRPVGEVAQELEKLLEKTPPLPGRYRLEDRLKNLKSRAAAARSEAEAPTRPEN